MSFASNRPAAARFPAWRCLALCGALTLLACAACIPRDFANDPPELSDFHFDDEGDGRVSVTIYPNDRIHPDHIVTIEHVEGQYFLGGATTCDGSGLCGYQSSPFIAAPGELIQISWVDPAEEGGAICLVVGFTDPPTEAPLCGG